MKMVKSLLLGSAAGVVAVAGAQAADLPVKAKAVEYVKICSLYGAGFYYIPGTDICMKVGGFVRYQADWMNGGNNMSNGAFSAGGGRDNRLDSQDIITRARAVATFDTRQQTQYGVLRTYLLFGFSQDPAAASVTSSNTIYATRGFIQIAGFTFGKATSYMDFFNAAAISYNAGFLNRGSDTGDTGQIVAAYTGQFGGGVSATLSVEQSQRSATVFQTATAYSLGAAPTANALSSGQSTTSGGIPDIVGNLRWDGTWGAFQLAGVLHDASGGYYGLNETLGHPSNKWGYAVNTGLRINAPMFGPGDYFQTAFNYSVGAAKFAASAGAPAWLIWNGGNLAYGNIEDGIYGGTATSGLNSIELTTAWSVAASYEHFWTPALQTSLYGSYLKVSHNSNATALICSSGTTNGLYTVSSTCNPDWSFYSIGSRTQWNVTKSLYLGLDVIYSKLKSSLPGTATNTITSPSSGAKSANIYGVSDQSAWAFAFRIQRDIVP